jgi:hypothetical protein
LLGIWKNVADLEESLSLPELRAILEAAREKEHREHTFLAALKGIDLNEGQATSVKDKFEEVQKRVELKLHGEEKVAQYELNEFGLEIETEE